MPDLTERSERVRRAAALHDGRLRRKRREFLVEGPHAITEGLRAQHARILDVFVTAERESGHDAVLERARIDGVPVHSVSGPAMRVLADTVSPAGIVAVVADLDATVEQAIPPLGRLVAVLANIRDPGNAGTLIRTADAAGCDGVVFAGDCVDPHNSKAVRASAGSIFHLPIAVAPDVEAVIARCRETGLALLGADGTADLDITSNDAAEVLRRPTAWVFGNEAWGLPSTISDRLDRAVRIPIHGRAESLNLAAAAALCLYASATAQRRVRPT